MDKHEFSPQREPFTSLCSECGMGKIAIYHNGPRYQTVVVTGRNKIIDREGARGQIATADSDEDAQTITEALNSYDALREAAAKAAIPYEALLMDSESRRWIAPEVWTAMENAVAELRAALHPQPEETK